MWDARPNAPSAGAETRDLRLSRAARKRVKVCAQYAYALGLASHHAAGCPSYPSHHVAGCHRTCDVTSARRARLPLDLKLVRPGGRVIFAGCAQLRRRQTAQRRAGGDAQPRPRGLRARDATLPDAFWAAMLHTWQNGRHHLREGLLRTWQISGAIGSWSPACVPGLNASSSRLNMRRIVILLALSEPPLATPSDSHACDPYGAQDYERPVHGRSVQREALHLR